MLLLCYCMCRWLESQISAGGGPFVCGSSFSLADAAVAPFMLRLPVLGELAGYQVPQGDWGLGFGGGWLGMS
jgi:glutathione S-transferase